MALFHSGNNNDASLGDIPTAESESAASLLQLLSFKENT